MKKLVFIVFSLCFFSSYAQSNIFDASRSGNLEDVISLYDTNSNCINNIDENGYSPLILASYNGNYEVVEFLVTKVNNINGTSKYGTPLMAAVVKGNTSIAKLLLENKAETDIADANGTTALHYAVLFKNYEMIELLVNANANINLKDNRDQSALDYAKLFNDEKLINLLKH